MVCPHGKGGMSQCGHFSDKGGWGQFFRDFVRTSFMDGPLLKTVVTFNHNTNGAIVSKIDHTFQTKLCAVDGG